MGEVERHTPQAHPVAERVAALSDTYAVLARLFAYPSPEAARRMVCPEFLDACQALAQAAGLQDARLERAFVAAQTATHDGVEEAAHALRHEHTRLFWAPLAPLSLEGHVWVTGEARTPDAQKRGERVAVAQLYADLGLRNRVGVNTPADNLSSELDYARYAARAEASAWGSDGASAREWGHVREAFTRDHLGPLARGVAAAVVELSGNPHLRCFAELLAASVR